MKEIFSFLRFKKDIELNNDLIIINTIQGYRILYFYFLNFRIPTIAAAGEYLNFLKLNIDFLVLKKYVIFYIIIL